MYYLLWRGKITGPFQAEKIKLMLKGGQISSLYQASQDQQSWETINKIDALSVSSQKSSSAIPDKKSTNITFSEKSSAINIKQPEALPQTPQQSDMEIIAPNDNQLKSHITNNSNIVLSCPLCDTGGIKLEPPIPQSITCRYCETIIPIVENEEWLDNETITDSFTGYEIAKVLGVGGMGVVYQACQSRLNNREVALKVLTEEMSSGNQIENEVAALVRLSHPSIVTIFDLVSNDKKTAIVMELILGPGGTPLSLRSIMDANGPASNYESAIKACRTICKALSYAHQQGVFHLDLKPENILIDHHGHLKIVDFGIARFDESKKQMHTKNCTLSSDVYGTVGYSAPERRMKQMQPQPNQDVYSLGVILYELLMGVLPEGRFELPSEVNPDMPAVLDSLIETSLNYHQERRYPSMDEFDHALTNAGKVVKAGTSRSKKIDLEDTLEANGFQAKKPFAVSIKNPKISIGKNPS